MKKIIIVGAGFAGLSALVTLINNKVEADIRLFDKNEDFEYCPSLPLCIGDEGYFKNTVLPLKKYFSRYFVHEKVLKIAKDKIVTEKSEYSFDYLVVATGALTNTYGNESLARYAFPFKGVRDVKNINARLKKAKTITVIGGGYTGVEIAGILSEIKGKKISVVHPRSTVLDTMNEKTRLIATRHLEKKGVRLLLNERAAMCTQDGVSLQSGKKVKSDLTILVAGIKPNDSMVEFNTELRMDLSSREHPNIFFAGDAAKSGMLTTGHNAMLEGRRVAAGIIKQMTGEEIDSKLKDFRLLAVYLGRQKGIITGTRMSIYFPYTGLAKWLIERRVMFEFKRRVQLWL